LTTLSGAHMIIPRRTGAQPSEHYVLLCVGSATVRGPERMMFVAERACTYMYAPIWEARAARWTCSTAQRAPLCPTHTTLVVLCERSTIKPQMPKAVSRVRAKPAALETASPARTARSPRDRLAPRAVSSRQLPCVLAKALAAAMFTSRFAVVP